MLFQDALAHRELQFVGIVDQKACGRDDQCSQQKFFGLFGIFCQEIIDDDQDISQAKAAKGNIFKVIYDKIRPPDRPPG